MTQASIFFLISHSWVVAAYKGMPVEPFFGLIRASGILLNARKTTGLQALRYNRRIGL